MGKTFISGYKKRTQFAKNVRKCVRNLHNLLIISIYCGERGIILNLSQPFLKSQEISSLFSEAL